MELVQAVCLKPMIDLFRSRGINVDLHLEKTGLTKFSPKKPRSWLPKKLVFDFINRLDKNELSNNPVEDIESVYRLENMAHYGDYLLSSKSMLQAAKRATSLNARILTYHTVGISLNGLNPAITSKYHHKPERAESIIEGCSLILMLDGISRFGKRRSELKSLSVTSREIPRTTLPIDLSKTRIRVGQPAHVASFPAEWLLRKPEFSRECSSIPDAAPGSRTSDRLLSLLNSLEPGERPTIGPMAAAIGISSRSMQRQLQSEGTTFFCLVNQWAAQVSTMRLKHSRATIVQISGDLGYSDSSHFIRAFQRWEGMSPQAYRERYAADRA